MIIGIGSNKSTRTVPDATAVTVNMTKTANTSCNGKKWRILRSILVPCNLKESNSHTIKLTKCIKIEESEELT